MKIRMFGEWEKQELIMFSLPHKNSDWCGYLSEILQSYAELIGVVSKFQKVLLIAPDDENFKKYFSYFNNTCFIKIPTNDTWIRDYGAIDVQIDDKIMSLDFKFNAWGGKFSSDLDNNVNKILFNNYLKTELKSIDFILEGGSVEFNANGVMLTTKQCLLNQNRNFGLNFTKIDTKLKEIFGLDRIIWLENGFILGDDTDSHIDTLARFINEKTIAYSICENKTEPEFDALLKMEKELEKTGFELIALPLPKPKFYNGKKLPATYANFVFVNNALIVPTYNDKNDEIVINLLQKALLSRKVIGVNAEILIRQNGSIHCACQNRFLGVRREYRDEND